VLPSIIPCVHNGPMIFISAISCSLFATSYFQFTWSTVKLFVMGLCTQALLCMCLPGWRALKICRHACACLIDVALKILVTCVKEANLQPTWAFEIAYSFANASTVLVFVLETVRKRSQVTPRNCIRKQRTFCYLICTTTFRFCHLCLLRALYNIFVVTSMVPKFFSHQQTAFLSEGAIWNF
jgi:hypothetical protein